MKTVFKTFLIASLFLAIGIPAALAQDDFRFLAPLPGIAETGDPVTLAQAYIPAAIRLIIAFAAAFAVVRIIFGGIQYMSTDAFGKKGEAKKSIQESLWGLLLVVASFVILGTVNPALIGDITLKLPQLESPSNAGGTPLTRGPSYGKPWPSDAAVRATLGVQINVNKDNCETIGQSNCTSLTGLSSKVLTGLKNLQRACFCQLTVTGGTEYWLHGNRSSEIESNRTDHKPGGRAADLSLNENISSLLRSTGTQIDPINNSCSSIGSEAYTYQGATYVNEHDHWHVCF